jgi:hypothetical protein
MGRATSFAVTWPVVGLAGGWEWCGRGSLGHAGGSSRRPRISQWMQRLVLESCLRNGVGEGSGDGLGARVHSYACRRICLYSLVDPGFLVFHPFSFGCPPSLYTVL